MTILTKGANLRDKETRKYSLDQSLVDAHLVGIPGLGTFTVGGLTGGDLEGLGGKADYESELAMLQIRCGRQY